MNNDLISREALKEDLRRYFTKGEALYQILNIIDNAPTVELNDKSLEIARKSIELGRNVGKLEGKLERPQGEWIEYKEDNEIRYYCSNCKVTKGQAVNNFCACCGAKMQKGGAE